ncbi:MAG: phage shock protein A [Arenicella sp.]|jgi:phage shock protein A
MSILKSLITAIRGNVSSAGEAIIDHQAITILEQSIRDGNNNLAQSKIGIRNLKAEAIKLDTHVAELGDDIEGYTAKAKQALSAGNEDLARKTAQRIAELTDQRSSSKTQADKLSSQVETLYKKVKSCEEQLRKDRIDLEQLKSFEAVYKVQQTIASATPAVDSDRKRIERAKSRVAQRQADVEAKMEADEWLDDAEKGDDLDGQLSAAGIGNTGTSADDILASLK